MYPTQRHGVSEGRPSSQAIKMFYYLTQNLQPAIRATPAWEDNQRASTLYEEIKPLMITLKMLGVLPYSTTPTGVLKFKWLSAAMLYSLVFITFISTSVSFALLESYPVSPTEKLSFANKAVYFAEQLFVSSVFMIPTNHWLETGKKLKFINSWTDLQTEYKQLTGRCLYLGLRRKVVVLFSVSVAIITAFSVMICMTGLLPHWYQVVGFVFPFSITVFLPLLWILTCTTIIKVARELADEMEHHFSRGPGALSKISSYGKFWLRLGKLTQDLGRSTGFTFGGQTLLFFTLSVLLSYDFMVQPVANFSYISLVMALLFQAIIFLECNSAQNASNEVGINFSDRLQSITNSLPLICTEEINEMRHFLAAIGRNPPTINFAGFVDVNRGLVTSFISAMVTYLVVLAQFQMSDNSPQ